MSDRYFVDTNILMHAHDAAAGEKHEKARALARNTSLTVSVTAR
jgi:predicted nucleic acid-binding protein